MRRLAGPARWPSVDGIGIAVRKTRVIYRLTNARSGQVIVETVALANGWLERYQGLLGRRNISPDEGLWIDPCNGIHTFGMRFPIDVLVLDRDQQVLRIAFRVPAWRVLAPMRGGRSVIELAAGVAQRAGLAEGDVVVLEAVHADR